jgi:hypothetical protein
VERIFGLLGHAGEFVVGVCAGLPRDGLNRAFLGDVWGQDGRWVRAGFKRRQVFLERPGLLLNRCIMRRLWLRRKEVVDYVVSEEIRRRPHDKAVVPLELLTQVLDRLRLQAQTLVCRTDLVNRPSFLAAYT